MVTQRKCMLILVVFLGTLTAGGKVLLTRDDALAKVFPGAEIKRVEVFLSKEQVARIAKSAGTDFHRTIVYRYEAHRDGKLEGVAYFDAHKVRTLPEILMIAVTPDGTIRELEVLSFKEPMEYLPGRRWYEQFLHKPLNDDLRIGRDIDGVVGATLTARATSLAVRRVLAAHSAIEVQSAP